MAFATFMVHVRAGASRSWPRSPASPSFEPPLGYLAIAVVLMLVGPGRIVGRLLLFGKGPIITPGNARRLSA